MLVKIKDMPRHIKGWENLTEEDQTMITNRQKAAKAKQQENKAKRVRAGCWCCLRRGKGGLAGTRPTHRHVGDAARTRPHTQHPF
jgi:hypothetical protein